MSMPGTKPARQTFPPPVPTAGVPDPGDGEPAARAHAVQTAVAQQYQAWRDAHPADIEPDVLKANAGAFMDAPAMQQLSPTLRAVEADTDQAGKHLTEVVNNTRVTPENEARANRVWGNALRVLDAKSDLSQVVDAARKLVAGAGDDLPVFVESLGPYLESRGVPTDWLAIAYADAIPGLAEAHAEARRKTKALAIVRSNHDRLTNAVAKDHPAPHLLNPTTVDGSAYRNPTEPQAQPQRSAQPDAQRRPAPAQAV